MGVLANTEGSIDKQKNNSMDTGQAGCRVGALKLYCQKETAFFGPLSKERWFENSLVEAS